MTDEILSADEKVLDLLRRRPPMTVAQLASATGVTATAVRQRLNRLMRRGFVQRTAARAGRGRPSHYYSLTAKGRRKTGANFADLAVALWEEIRGVEDPQARRGLLQRISGRLARVYARRIEGETLGERMESLAKIFQERRIPFTVETRDGRPVLTLLACPYPDLANRDHEICQMERAMLSDLLGEELHLVRCPRDEENGCRFEPVEMSRLLDGQEDDTMGDSSPSSHQHPSESNPTSHERTLD